jgi:cell shape-determining protein MreC
MGTALTGSVGDTVNLDTKASLQEDRDRLMRANETLTNQNGVLAARAADLERLLGGRAEAPAGIVAAVLARPPVSPYDMLVVDQGARAGVTEGSAVYGAGGIPVGTVADVVQNSARVSLYSTTGRVTEGWLGANRLPVQLIGAGAGAFDARVDAATGILVGDAVYVPGPGALPIGTVTEVITDPSSPNIILRIRGQASPFSMTWVTIAP